MVVLNKDSKYFLQVNETNFGVEKWKAFKDSTGKTPPTTATQYVDFISVDYTDGEMGDPQGDSEPNTDGHLGAISASEATHSRQPNPTLFASMRDIMFLLSSWGQVIGSDGLNSNTVNLLIPSTISKIRSSSIYLGKYTDNEWKVTGNQINELTLEFGDNGVIPTTYSAYASHEGLDLLKNQANVTSNADPTKPYPNVPRPGYSQYSKLPLESAMLNSIYLYKGSGPLNLNRIINMDLDNDLIQIGCRVSGTNISLSAGISDEDTSYPCRQLESSSVNDSMIPYKAESIGGSDQEKTIELTNKQTTSRFLELYYGGAGVSEFTQTNNYSIVLYLINSQGESLLLATGATLNLSSPSLSKEAEETLTFNFASASFISPGDSTLTPRSGTLLCYNYGSGATTGVGYAKCTISTSDITSGVSLLVRRADNQTIHRSDFNDLVFNQDLSELQAGDVILPLFQRGQGDQATTAFYNLIRLSVDSSGNPIETIRGTFKINAGTNTKQSPLNITSIWTTSE
jgi:hypothetical protein